MTRHVPVLKAEVLHALNLAPGKNIIDATLGDAGHAEEILKLTSPDGKLLGIDADPEGLLRAKKFLYEVGPRVTFVRDNFSGLKSIVAREQFGPVHGVLLDLGWSTPQFEDRGRGFSFLADEPLDMRYGGKEQLTMNNEQVTAADVISESLESRLEEIFRVYGEEKLSKEIAQAIVTKRKEKKIETSGELAEIVLQVYREKLKTDKEVPWIGGLHPATKVFQALRIEVNQELEVLKAALPQIVEVLEPGGRAAIISFHSLEDRIVKHFFKSQNTKNITIITKKPIVCSDEEAKDNPPSRSAKLRVIEKVS